MHEQLTLFEIETVRPKPCCGNCKHYSWKKYFGGRYQECDVLLNKAGRPLRPKAGSEACGYYKLNELIYGN